MAEVLSAERIEELVGPFLEGTAANLANPAAAGRLILPESLFPRLAAYLDLLVRWNARTNLSAIREPEEIVRRHFGESLFAGVALSTRLGAGATLLDVGSGAGFPGLPIQLLRPDLGVTLAESQGKKATFLREAVRTLGLKTEVFAARVETMPPTRTFDAVTLRAVDKMKLALELAKARISPGGWLAVLESGESRESGGAAMQRLPIPGRENSFLELSQT